MKNFRVLYGNLPSYLIIFLPIFLITGPFLPDLSVVIISFFFIFTLKKKNLIELFQNKFVKIFAGFYFYLIINAMYNLQGLSTFITTLGYIRFFIFVFAVGYFINKYPFILKGLFISFSLCFSILIIDGFVQYFNQGNLFGMKVDATSRVSSFFGDELILGSYLSRLYPIYFGISILLFGDKFKKILFVSIIFIFAEIIIFLSGERSAFFYLNLSAIFMLIFLKNFKVLRFIIMISGFLILFIIININTAAKKRIIDQSVRDMGFSQTYDKKYIFTQRHHEHYIAAYNIFLDNKFFGIGIKNFKNVCGEKKYKTEYSCSTHPHNFYLQFLSELGLFGFLFIIFSLFFLIYNLLKHLYFKYYKKIYYFDDYQICLLAAVLITIWPFVPTGNFFNNWLNVIHYFPLGLILFNKNSKTSS
jgi:O-antigen ligase